jgi:hypothetical protein
VVRAVIKIVIISTCYHIDLSWCGGVDSSPGWYGHWSSAPWVRGTLRLKPHSWYLPVDDIVNIFKWVNQTQNGSSLPLATPVRRGPGTFW